MPPGLVISTWEIPQKGACSSYQAAVARVEGAAREGTTRVAHITLAPEQPVTPRPDVLESMTSDLAPPF